MQVLITGGAKRVGRYLSQYFAAQGYDVLIHVNESVEEGNELVLELKHKYPEQSFTLLQYNLVMWEQIKPFINSVFDKHGLPDVIIHNASYYLKKTLSETLEADINAMMGIHLYTPMLINQVYNMRGGIGNIITILDTAIKTNSSSHAMYLLAKKSLSDYTKMAAQEFAPQNRVNGIALGPVLPPEGKNAHYFNEVVDNTPLRCRVDLESISTSINYVLNNKNLTGQIIYCDSGQHLL